MRWVRIVGRVAALSLLAGTLSVLAAEGDLREERMIAPGVKYVTIRRAVGPQVIRVIEIERVSGYIRALPALAAERGQALVPVSEIAARVSTDSAYAVAAVNGDYFVMEAGPTQGDPLGVAVLEGEVVSTPFPRSALVIDREGRASVRLLRLEAWVARADGSRHPLHAVNEARGADRMVLYTSRHGASTRTNGSGTEVTLGDVALPVRAGVSTSAVVRAVRRRGGDTPVPSDGLVLSGHGTGATFLEGLVPGDTLTFRLDFQPPLPEGAHVLGGGPRLLVEGKEIWQSAAREERFGENLITRRHPRTAAGINGSRLLLVTVDGRQPEVSAGMDLTELTALMRELGCSEAINLDGGGSTTLWVRGAVENRPSDGRERRVANALVVFSTAPKGPPARLRVIPQEAALLAGASLPLLLSAEDEFYNPVALPPGETVWEIDPALGTVDAEGRLTAGGPHPPAPSPKNGRGGVRFQVGGLPSPILGRGAGGEGPSLHRSDTTDLAVQTGLLSVRRGGLRAAIPTRVYSQPPRLAIGPEGMGGSGWLPSGAAQRFTARAFDEAGRPLAIPPGAVAWECDPLLGAIDAEGRLAASAGPARGTVSAILLGVRTSVDVAVGSVERLIDDFEMPGGWRATTFPVEVVGSLAPTEERPHGGARALGLAYDFSRGAGNRAVYATLQRDLGAPLALRLWARGDGGGAWLRARLRDAKGISHTLEFTRALGLLPDWQEFRAPIPPAAVAPITLESLYLVETRATARGRGQVVLDDLICEYRPE
jgi:hypothetical protein